MRKISQITAQAFLNRRFHRMGNTEAHSDALYLFGNCIAQWDKDDNLWIIPVHTYSDGQGYTCGLSSTTADRLNTLLCLAGSSYSVGTYKQVPRLYKNGVIVASLLRGHKVCVIGPDNGLIVA